MTLGWMPWCFVVVVVSMKMRVEMDKTIPPKPETLMESQSFSVTFSTYIFYFVLLS